MIFDKPLHYIKLFTCCFAFNGASRSIICDVQRSKFKLIPNALFDLIQKFDELCTAEIIKFYGESNENTVKDYIEFLYENEFIHFCEEKNMGNFPQINVGEFNLPNSVYNAIWEVGHFDWKISKQIIEQLDDLLCFSIEIRLQNIVGLNILVELLSLFDGTAIKDITLIAIDNSYDLDNLKNLFFTNLRLNKLILCDSNTTKVHADFFLNSQIIFTSKALNNSKCCGNFPQYQFINNVQFIAESQQYNTCLNRKITIDIDGNFKNCPAMNETFGNIKQEKIADVILKEDFRRKWQIRKDEIKVCKDCEFRYICMDCRGYLSDPKDLNSKPLKCGYNPYTCEWEEWSSNPLKKDAIEYYGLNKIN